VLHDYIGHYKAWNWSNNKEKN